MSARMREPEASEYLGLTVRTLRNYRRKGKLPFRETQGRTRPVIEYDRSDLDRLKAELSARQQRHREAPSGSRTNPRVTFGLPRQEYEELASDAARVGLSVSEYARRLARDRMESQYLTQAGELRAGLERTNDEVRRIRDEFAAGIEAVLECVGIPAADAMEWVSKNLR
jgi:hypothetical protein